MTQEEEMITQSVFNHENLNRNILSYKGESLSQNSFNTLKPSVWLNDEVINIYSKLIITELQEKGEKIYCFRSDFMNQLNSEGKFSYEKVKRWSRHVPNGDIFELEKLFIPINIDNMHWILAVIYMQEKRIQIYDSYNSPGIIYLNNLIEYLKCEYQDKKNAIGNWKNWNLVSCQDDTPSQTNSYDCGVFVCMYIQFIADNRELNFNQDDVSSYRKFIAYQLAILNKKNIV